jgi:WXXGXW repeat (2 copies)
MRVFFWIIAPILLALAVVTAPPKSMAQVTLAVNISVEPPDLPDYDQPEIPGPGYIWTPGYWAWGDDGYFWVPGTWVEPPEVGFLWTPGYWGFRDGFYVWNEGYWGTHIGFYGGVNYGFGYVGTGYLGGSWRGGVFAYNSAVNNFGSVHITNVYNQTIVNNTTIVNKVSFNGGSRGVQAQPNAQELAAAHENHIKPTTLQTQNMTMASKNKAFLASVNQGKPAIAATSKPGQFTGSGVVAARSGNFRGGTNTGTGVTGHSNVGSSPTSGGLKSLNANTEHQQQFNANTNQQHFNANANQQHFNANATNQQHFNANQGHINPNQGHVNPPPMAHTPPKGPPPKRDKEKKG